MPKKRTSASSLKRSSKASSSQVKVEDGAEEIAVLAEPGADVELEGEARGEEDGDGAALPTVLETTLQIGRAHV